MNSTVIVALISFAGTLLGTFSGIICSSKLVNYRLEQLEKKVESHNSATARLPVIEEKIKTINRRIAKIEHIDTGDFCGVN
ncbi:MAG: hypothetical protein E7537_04485 [Ruminococcaceae bacterium]|nr:hypothetical protein [Oscillospiraceae bacterium]